MKIKELWNKFIEQKRNLGNTSEREISGSTQKARDRVEAIPIKGTLKEPLLYKLLSCDLLNPDMNDLLDLVQCLKSAKTEDSNELGERLEQNIDCKICKRNYANKAQHTKHLNKEENVQCKNYYEKEKNAFKFCDYLECNFMSKSERVITQHRRFECDGLEHDFANRIPFRLNQNKKMQVAGIESTLNGWKCQTCNKGFPMDDLTRAVMHRTSHKINTNELNERQILKRKRSVDLKVANFKKRKTENMDKLPRTTINGDPIPEPARPEILMGKTDVTYLDGNLIWRCKKCEYINDNYQSMACHMKSKHKLHTTQENGRVKCPFCNTVYFSYAGLKAHIFFKNGCNNYTDLQNSTSPIDGPEIWRRIVECNSHI